jgi:hypothetical protein
LIRFDQVETELDCLAITGFEQTDALGNVLSISRLYDLTVTSNAGETVEFACGSRAALTTTHPLSSLGRRVYVRPELLALALAILIQRVLLFFKLCAAMRDAKKALFLLSLPCAPSPFLFAN